MGGDPDQETAMKYIIAVIKPHKLDAVREAVTGMQVQGMTISDMTQLGILPVHHRLLLDVATKV